MLKVVRAHKVTSLILALVLMFSIVVTGCALIGRGGQATIRATVNAAPVLLNSLEASKAITHRQRVCAGDNFVLAGNIGLDLDSGLKAAETPTQKADAAHRAYVSSRVILTSEVDGQLCFKSHPKIEQAFTIIDGIFVFVDAYYADKAGRITHADVAVDGLSEREFKDALNQKLKDLKEALK